MILKTDLPETMAAGSRLASNGKWPRPAEMAAPAPRCRARPKASTCQSANAMDATGTAGSTPTAGNTAQPAASPACTRNATTSGARTKLALHQRASLMGARAVHSGMTDSTSIPLGAGTHAATRRHLKMRRMQQQLLQPHLRMKAAAPIGKSKTPRMGTPTQATTATKIGTTSSCARVDQAKTLLHRSKRRSKHARK